MRSLQWIGVRRVHARSGGGTTGSSATPSADRGDRWAKPRRECQVASKVVPHGDQRWHGGEPIHRLSAAGERSQHDDAAGRLVGLCWRMVVVMAAATAAFAGCGGRCAAGFRGRAGRLVEPAQIDSLLPCFVDRIFGRPDAVVVGPIHPLGERVAAAGSPTLFGRVAAAGAVHAGEQLAAFFREIPGRQRDAGGRDDVHRQKGATGAASAESAKKCAAASTHPAKRGDHHPPHG